jgi:2-oxo-4-hydroxy-4-carboxy-5-ureidoimidazoline decarboxylase
MTLDELNTLPRIEIERALGACCAAKQWIDGMTNARPFQSIAALLANSDALWHAMGPREWRDAMAHHPRIGERAAKGDALSRAWSAGEQAGAGAANADLRRALAQGNREYEARFGHTYVVNATGKTAAEMLSDLRRRLSNTSDEELAVAAEELRTITRLRLEKLVGVDQPVRR